MYDQLEQEGCWTFVTLSAGQSVIGPIEQTIFEADDVHVTIDGVDCVYDSNPDALGKFKLTFTPGVQGFTVTLGGTAVGGERLVVECDVDARRLAQFPTSGALPIGGLNDEQNFLARAIQSAARWQEIIGSFVRVRSDQDMGEAINIPAGTPGLFGVDAAGQLKFYTGADILDLVAGATITPQMMVTLLMQVLRGVDLDITDNGDGTVTLEPDLGGDLLLLEGDQQTGVGGGGNVAPLTLEDVADYLANTLFQEGTNVDLVYNDVANTLTINANLTGGLTLEQVMDQVATMFGENAPISAVYDDASDTYVLSLDQTALKAPSAWQIELVPLDTAITAGVKKKIRVPFGMVLTGARASLATAQTSGALVAVDILESGASIFGVNKLTIDNGETTSLIAATPVDLNDTNLADDAEMTFSVSGIGDGTAKGLTVTLLYRPA